MGVPKFYRWISERYPCLSEVLKEYQIPEFDNLYLDMNGIVHVCSHPDDSNPHFRITEEKIFADIFHYIEVLFRMIKPKKVFFMAIDGVAPRAKMNQQRGRRFRSAREAEDLEKKALEKGEILPSEARFDSNCITPGTEFMVKLHDQLQFFVANKVSTDKMWQGPRIYLSGHETPGEGEHKVMDFIRAEKSRPDFDPNTRHCLYGLDADLIMLGLASHEPHFSLLREEVRFGGKNQSKRSNAPEETTFHLLHLSLLREYLDFEFQVLKDKLPFAYDLERIIDDWILMGFLVGNDFVPHLPHMHINHECLPLLWKVYKRVLPSLDGYLHDAGNLNLRRFEMFIKTVALNDFEKFSEAYADLAWLESKKGGSNGYTPRRQKKASLSSKDAGIPSALDFLPGFMGQSGGDNSDSQDASQFSLSGDLGDDNDEFGNLGQEWEKDETFMQEFAKYKANYYMEKLEMHRVTPDVIYDLALGYVRAIQWILLYYFQGVPSWNWYYPHHYAPYISDIRGFSNATLTYDYAKPFLPFEQLMAVLPAASKLLLPKPYQALMTSESSPIKEFYPVDFETDMNGKQQAWEAVVLIPFIKEEDLLQSMASVADQCTDSEKARNSHGPHLLFTYTSERQPAINSTMPGTFPHLSMNYSKCERIAKDAFVISADQLNHGLCPGVRLDVYFPGFPTLKHIEHTAQPMKCGVKVFQMNSRGDNMILNITEKEAPNLEQLAKSLLGQSVFVNWPHLQEARVVCVSNDEFKYTLDNAKPHQQPDMSFTALDNDEYRVWHKEVEMAEEFYLNRKGVTIGPTHILLRACPLVGRKYICNQKGVVSLEKQWASHSQAYVHQASVRDISVQDPTYKQFQSLDQLFKIGTDVYMLGMPFYGASGRVLSIETEKDIRVRVSFTEPPHIDLSEAFYANNQVASNYMLGHIAAQRVGISPLLLARITGVMYVMRTSKNANSNQNAGRVNVGLNLKFNKMNKEVPGYTRRDKTEWVYSSRLVQVLRDYIESFPLLFAYLARRAQDDSFPEADIFNSPDGPTLRDVQDYLKKTPCAEVEPMTHGSQLLDNDVVAEIEYAVDEYKKFKPKRNTKKMQVRPHLLYKPLEAQVNLVPDPSTKYKLFDRVVNVREGYSVPLGLQGTVIGLILAEKDQDTLYEVVFDESFVGGLTLRSSPSRAYRVPPTALINISHGMRKDKKSPQKPYQVESPRNRDQQVRHKQNRDSCQNHTDQPRQILKKQYQSSPQSATKKAPTAPVPQQKLPPPTSDEFAQIWSQLQGAGDSSLSQAAKSLPKQPGKRIDRVGSGRLRIPDNEGSTKKIDIQQMFAAAAKNEIVPQKKGAAPPPGSTEVNQLEKMFQAASIEKSKSEGTAALCQMLHIGDESKDEAEQSKASYGQKVNVQDLFKGVQQQKAPTQAPRSKVVELLEWCQAQGVPSPSYLHHSQGGNFQAVVSLPSGMTFQGSWTPSKELASESAAAIALLQLNQQLPLRVMTGGFPVRPGLSTSPNSAFTPVRPPMNNGAMPFHPAAVPPYPPNFHMPPPHLFMAGPPPQLPPGFVAPPTQHMAPQQQQQQRAPVTLQKHTKDASSKTPPKEDGEKKNAFIPTQVLRQQKTPRKSESSPEASLPPTIVNETTPAEEPSPPRLSKLEKKPEPKTPKSANRSAGKRPKSRIAAKFGPS